VPENFDYRRSRATFAEWTKLGVKRADGGAYPETGDAILFFPTGVPGPAFVVTKISTSSKNTTTRMSTRSRSDYWPIACGDESRPRDLAAAGHPALA
jgi:hypothetical protein